MMKKNNEIINYKKQNTKHGAVIPMVALGILAVAGLVPFLFENTESNQKVTESVDTTNKITWALESAIEEKYKEINKDGLKGLASVTTNIEEQASVTFKYTNQIDASAGLAKYNSYLDKNSCLEAKGERIGNYDLSSLKLNMAKPGVAVINQDYYAWDKFGRLFKIEGSEKVLIPGLKVWQVVSNNGTPVVLTTKNKAYSITLDADNKPVKEETSLDHGSSKYIQISGNNGDGSVLVGIPFGSHKAYTCYGNEKTEISDTILDVSAGGSHGLAINDKKEIWEWGENSNGQCATDAAYVSTPIKINSANSKVTFNGESYGSTVPLIDNSDPVKRHLQDYYTDGKPISNGQIAITDKETGETIVHTVINDKNGAKGCECALCKDILSIGNGSGNIKLNKGGMPFKVEDNTLTVESLEFMMDLGYLTTGNKNKLSAADITEFECSIVNKTTGKEVLSFTSNRFKELADIQNKKAPSYFPALGDEVGLFAFSESELKKGGKNYATLEPGDYYVELFYSTSKKSHQEFANWSLFYGWSDSYTGAHGGKNAAGAKVGSDFYGGIFRMNDKIYNLCGKSQSKKEEVLFHAIAAGEDFSLAVVSSKKEPDVYTIAGWGNNDKCQLGLEELTDKQIMKEVKIGSDTKDLTHEAVAKYHDMKAGNTHALFLTTDGNVYTWGGSNSEKEEYMPHKLTFASGKKIISIAAGNDCSMALDENGNIYTWEVRDGTKSSGSIAIAIEGGNEFKVAEN